jgi:predicted lipoprotein with Yx(FWY)xxD motif
MIRPILIFGGSAAAAVLSLAACSSGATSSTYGAPSTSAPATSSAAPSTGTTSGAAAAAVSLGSTSLGKVLVDAQGFTLYLFAADTPSSSKCSGSCASAWPPATAAGTPVAGSGLTAKLLTTLTRADGTKQLEYNGHPLYTFKGDSGAGQANGEGSTAFGAYWYVLDASGNQK